MNTYNAKVRILFFFYSVTLESLTKRARKYLPERIPVSKAVRSETALQKLLPSDVTISGCTKTVREQLTKLKEDIEELSSLQGSDFSLLKAVLIRIGTRYNVSENTISKLIDNGQRKFKHLLYLSIIAGKYNERDKNPLRKSVEYGFYKSNESTLFLENVGKQMGVTRERIRQIKQEYNDFVEVLLKGFLLIPEFIDTPKLDHNIYLIDKIFTEKINAYYSIGFNHRFYRHIFPMIFPEYKVLRIYNTPKRSGSYYLVKKEDVKNVEMTRLILDIERSYNLIKRKKVHSDVFFSKFIKGKKEAGESTKNILKFIIHKEYNFIPDSEGYYTFTEGRRDILEVLLEILGRGGMYTPTELRKAVNEERDSTVAIEYIRALIYNNKEHFIKYRLINKFGLKSLYTEENKHLAESLAEFAVRFLQKCDEPVSMKVLQQSLLPYRKFRLNYLFSRLSFKGRDKIKIFRDGTLVLTGKEVRSREENRRLEMNHFSPDYIGKLNINNSTELINYYKRTLGYSNFVIKAILFPKLETLKEEGALK